MHKLIFVVVFINFAVSNVYADCLEEGLESFKQVANSIYDEMGRPKVNLKNMEKMQHEMFIRPFDKEPAFHRHSNISWIEHPDGMGAVVSCVENEESVSQRVIWRPDEDLENIEMDAVISY